MSTQPGLVPQEKFSMTQACIWGATVFLNDATRSVRVHRMQDTSVKYTLKAKESFERDCMTRNVVPKHYHADNG